VGATTGRSRNDRDQTLAVPIKDIYLRPLHADFRRRLCAPACVAELGDAAGRPACSLPDLSACGHAQAGAVLDA
jgi:hypothetical protein